MQNSRKNAKQSIITFENSQFPFINCSCQTNKSI